MRRILATPAMLLPTVALATLAAVSGCAASGGDRTAAASGGDRSPAAAASSSDAQAGVPVLFVNKGLPSLAHAAGSPNTIAVVTGDDAADATSSLRLFDPAGTPLGSVTKSKVFESACGVALAPGAQSGGADDVVITLDAHYAPPAGVAYSLSGWSRSAAPLWHNDLFTQPATADPGPQHCPDLASILSLTTPATRAVVRNPAWSSGPWLVDTRTGLMKIEPNALAAAGPNVVTGAPDDGGAVQGVNVIAPDTGKSVGWAPYSGPSKGIFDGVARGQRLASDAAGDKLYGINSAGDMVRLAFQFQFSGSSAQALLRDDGAHFPAGTTTLVEPVTGTAVAPGPLSPSPSGVVVGYPERDKPWTASGQWACGASSSRVLLINGSSWVVVDALTGQQLRVVPSDGLGCPQLLPSGATFNGTTLAQVW